MPGTLVQDALAPQLLAGATLNAAGTTNGTAVQVDRPADISFVLDTSTVTSTGNTATLKVVLQGSDVVGFGSGVVTYGTIESTGTDAVQTAQANRTINARLYKKFVRAVVTLGGTAPVYTGSVLHVRPPHERRTPSTSA